MGCDASIVEEIRPAVVSIRAPTRGAGKVRKVLVFFPDVSIRAPTRGAILVAKNVEIRGRVSIRAPT